MEEDGFANVKEVPEGANEKLMKDFGRMTGELRGEHEGRKGPHWCKFSRSSHSALQQKILYMTEQDPDNFIGVSAFSARHAPKTRTQRGWSHAHPVGICSGRQRPEEVLC